jgi:hypothetical protein
MAVSGPAPHVRLTELGRFVVCAAPGGRRFSARPPVGVVADGLVCINDIWPMPHLPGLSVAYLILGGRVVYVRVSYGR